MWRCNGSSTDIFSNAAFTRTESWLSLMTREWSKVDSTAPHAGWSIGCNDCGASPGISTSTWHMSLCFRSLHSRFPSKGGAGSCSAQAGDVSSQSLPLAFLTSHGGGWSGAKDAKVHSWLTTSFGKPWDTTYGLLTVRFTWWITWGSSQCSSPQKHCPGCGPWLRHLT